MIYIVIMILGLVVDRLTKMYAVDHFIANPVYTKFFNFIYLENRGAAFGILQDRRYLFIILTVSVVSILLYYFFKNYKNNSRLLNLALAFVISGALGNFYDRLVHKYVVDFIEFSFVNFPVFNIADTLITIGCVLLIIYTIFYEEKKVEQKWL